MVGRRAGPWRWLVALVVAASLAAGLTMGARALNGDGGGGECADLQPVVDVQGHTERMIDPMLAPGQYDITVQLTITNPGDDPIQIGGIDLAMAAAPDVRVYGSGDLVVLEGGETRAFEATGPILLEPPLVPLPRRGVGQRPVVLRGLRRLRLLTAESYGLRK